MEELSDLLKNATFSKESRAENIAAILKEGIIKGYWKPGSPINDLDLSKKLGVSRTSVREALSRLVESRIIERVHWKGFYVRNIDWKEIESIFEIRMSLEKLAFSKALNFITDKDIDELEAYIEQAEEKIRTDEKDGFMQVDPLFHNKICEISGNEWISYTLNNSLTLLNVLRYMDKQGDFKSAAVDSVNQHREILEQIKKHDRQGVLDKLEYHINAHKQRLHHLYAASMLETEKQ